VNSSTKMKLGITFLLAASGCGGTPEQCAQPQTFDIDTIAQAAVVNGGPWGTVEQDGQIETCQCEAALLPLVVLSQADGTTLVDGVTCSAQPGNVDYVHECSWEVAITCPLGGDVSKVLITSSTVTAYNAPPQGDAKFTANPAQCICPYTAVYP
jgi:hypothetical protein